MWITEVDGNYAGQAGCDQNGASREAPQEAKEILNSLVLNRNDPAFFRELCGFARDLYLTNPP